MTDLVTAFDAAAQAALEAARLNDLPLLVQRIGEADTAFQAAVGCVGHDALRERIRQTVSPLLKQEPELVARLNFAASLAASGSQGPFFHTARQMCAERAEELPPAELPGIVESFRRTKMYKQMDFFADLLLRKLEGGTSQADWKVRAKNSYELSMAVIQHAEDGPTAAAQALYQIAMNLAHRSAQEAEQAGDAKGRLYALMLVGALQLKMGNVRESIQLSAQVSDEAENLAAAAPDDGAKQRLLRIAMNTCFHRMNAGVEHDHGVELVREMLAKIETNPIYQSAKDADWATGPIGKARKYLQQKAGH